MRMLRADRLIIRNATIMAEKTVEAAASDHVLPQGVVADLIATTPGEEGAWFVTAKDLKLYDLALELAIRSLSYPEKF